MASSLERAPRPAPKESPKAPDIDFSAEGLFTTEISTLPIAIEQEANELVKREEFRDVSYLERFEKVSNMFRSRYKELAGRQGVEPEARYLIDTMFETIMAWELSSERYRHLSGIERIAHEAAAQQSAVRYIHEVNQRHEKSAPAILSRYWTAQEQAWTRIAGRTFGELDSFDQYRNGILRQVAIEHVIRTRLGWYIEDPESTSNDIHRKIDVLTGTKNYALALQIKPIDVQEEQIYQDGLYVQVVDPTGPPEAEPYLYQFQRGVKSFAQQEGLPIDVVRGVFLGVSAKNRYINKVTGLPTPEFTQTVTEKLSAVDTASPQSRQAG